MRCAPPCARAHTTQMRNSTRTEQSQRVTAARARRLFPTIADTEFVLRVQGWCVMAAALRNINEWAAAGQRAHSLHATPLTADRRGEDHGQVLCDGRRDATPGSPPGPGFNPVGESAPVAPQHYTGADFRL